MPLVVLQNFMNDLVSDSPHMGRARSAQPHLTTHEVVDPLRSVLLKVHRSCALNDFIEAKNLGLVETVVVEAIVEALADILQAPTELISTPSLEL
jgi:hypothetical protein